MISKQIKIKLKEDGKNITVYIRPENYEVARKLKILFAQEYHKLIKMGVPSRAAMLDLLKREGLWTDEQDEALSQALVSVGLLETMFENTEEGENKRKLVIDLMHGRNKILELIQIKSEPMSNVAEVIAEDIQRENYLVESTFYEDGRKYFKNYDDFKNRRLEDPVIKIHEMFIKTLNLDNTNALLNLPEHKWLIENKLMDNKGDILDQELIEQLNEVKKEEPKLEVQQEPTN